MALYKVIMAFVEVRGAKTGAHPANKSLPQGLGSSCTTFSVHQKPLGNTLDRVNPPLEIEDEKIGLNQQFADDVTTIVCLAQMIIELWYTMCEWCIWTTMVMQAIKNEITTSSITALSKDDPLWINALQRLRDEGLSVKAAGEPIRALGIMYSPSSFAAPHAKYLVDHITNIGINISRETVAATPKMLRNYLTHCLFAKIRYGEESCLMSYPDLLEVHDAFGKVAAGTVKINKLSRFLLTGPLELGGAGLPNVITALTAEGIIGAATRLRRGYDPATEAVKDEAAESAQNKVAHLALRCSCYIWSAFATHIPPTSPSLPTIADLLPTTAAAEELVADRPTGLDSLTEAKALIWETQPSTRCRSST